jgi:hypothetical protein
MFWLYMNQFCNVHDITALDHCGYLGLSLKQTEVFLMRCEMFSFRTFCSGKKKLRSSLCFLIIPSNLGYWLCKASLWKMLKGYRWLLISLLCNYIYIYYFLSWNLIDMIWKCSVAFFLLLMSAFGWWYPLLFFRRFYIQFL